MKIRQTQKTGDWARQLNEKIKAEMEKTVGGERIGEVNRPRGYIRGKNAWEGGGGEGGGKAKKGKFYMKNKFGLK